MSPKVEATLTGWERAALAVERVRERLQRAAGALERAAVPYAVIGGNAVAEWVGRADVAAVRNTQDVDLLLRRADLTTAKAALEAAGFVYRRVKQIDMFLDGRGAKARDAVHIVYAAEIVRAGDPIPAPDVTESEQVGDVRFLALEPLVRMKLTAFRLKDRVHLQDLLEVGQIDESWSMRVPPELVERLRSVLDNPEGLPED